MLNWQHLLDGMIPDHHQDLFATRFSSTTLARCWFRREKARVVITGLHARWLVDIVKWVPGRLIGLGVRSFRLKFYKKKKTFLLWIVKNNGFLIIKYLRFVNFKLIFKKIIEYKKNSSFNWFTPLHVLIRPDVIWKKLSRPLYHVHFTVIHTNSRHKSNDDLFSEHILL